MSGMGDMGGMSGMDEGYMSEMMGEMSSNMGGAAKVDPDPADSRYVSEALDPIEATALRSALENNKPSNVSLAIAKRLPVMMSLKMNQRAVPELLAACGSAKLMIDVRQTRILPKVASRSGGAMASGGYGEMGGDSMEMDMNMGGGMGGMGGGMSGPMRGMGMSAAAKKPVDEFPLDMQVDIHGLIYIYNPPDREKLGLEQITEDTVAEAVQQLSGEAKTVASGATPAVPAAAAPDNVLPTPGATTAPATTTDPGAATPPATDPGAGGNPPVTTPPDAAPATDAVLPAGAPLTSAPSPAPPPALAN